MPSRKQFAAIALAGVCVFCLVWICRGGLLKADKDQAVLIADGRVHPAFTLRSSRGQKLRLDEVQASPASGTDMEQDGDAVRVFLRSPVAAGREVEHFTWRGRMLRVPVTFLTDNQPDPEQPNLPDWMVLHDAKDRTAFREWFTELAERAADAPPARLPAEIADCSALLRYAYREALRQHDEKWYAQRGADEMPALRSVQQWSYPNTPLGMGLFRTRPGHFEAADETDGTFGQFADAKTLVAANTFFVSRDVRKARPGDLIFYRLLALDSHNNSQYHSMVITGEHAEWVVYHTGPINKSKGEMRRVLLADLLRHPDPRWRPEPRNPNFLGIYRWSLLGEDQ